jgi:hypothetical protein
MRVVLEISDEGNEKIADRRGGREFAGLGLGSRPSGPMQRPVPIHGPYSNASACVRGDNQRYGKTVPYASADFGMWIKYLEALVRSITNIMN